MLSLYSYLILSSLSLSLQYKIKRDIKDLRQISFLKDKLDEAKKNVDSQINLLVDNSIKCVCLNDNSYPLYLRDLEDHPFVLFYKGSLENINNCISIVGPRKINYFNKIDAIKITSYFNKHNFSTVSGLAYGTDSLVASTSLDNNKSTFAYLCNGHNIDYPKSELKKKIIKNGAILSELWPNTKVNKYYIPYRNRLISSTGKALVLIDSPKKSGTRSTLKYALDLGKDVYLAPSSLNKDDSDLLGARILKL